MIAVPRMPRVLPVFDAAHPFRDIVLYRHKDLTKASKIVLQPHSSAFLKMSNHQAVMETELRHYSAISRGEASSPSLVNRVSTARDHA